MDDGRPRVLRLSPWYRGDSAGTAGVLRFVRRYGLAPEGIRSRLKHDPYDWSLEFGEFADEVGGEGGVSPGGH